MTPASVPPRWRVYLAVGRVSNLPTVWSNCLAGAVLALGAAPGAGIAVVTVAASIFYTGGMFLNDAFDAAFDRAHRPERPIPRGLVGEVAVRRIGFGLLAVAEVLLLLPRPGVSDSHSPIAAGFGLLLAALIVYYSWAHKRDPLSAVVMGLCRACVYCIAAAWVGDVVTVPVGAGAGALTLYVVGLSQLAKRDLVSGRTVAILIAGMSLLDAVFIYWASGRWDIALIAACGFPLTLAGQRFTPGT